MKRGGFVGIYIVLISLLAVAAHAESMNLTTEGSGYVLLKTPDVAPMSESFTIDLSYFYLNQLNANVSISLSREGKMYLQDILTPINDSATYKISILEPNTGLYTYTLFIREINVNDKIYETTAPLQVKVISKTAKNTNITFYKGIRLGEGLASDDLTIHEPYEAKGKTTYTIKEKKTGEVACDVQDGLVLFLPTDTFIGNSECIVKGTFNNITFLYNYILFVGSAIEVAAFEKEHGVKRDVEKTEAEVIIPTIDTPTITSSEHFSVITTLSPEVKTVDEPVVMKFEVSIPEGTEVSGIDRISLQVNDEFKELNCNDQINCVLEETVLFSKQGKNDYTLRVFLNTKEQLANSIQSNYFMTPEVGGLDATLFTIQSKNAYILTQAKVADLAIPTLGILATPDNQLQFADDEKLIAETLLKEYARKKRIGINTEGELKKAKEFAKYIIVTKTLTEKTAIDQDGERVLHTTFDLSITQKKQSFFDSLLGKRKLQNVTVLEHISKDAAKDLGHVRFENQEYEVILEDPLVVWHFDELKEEKIVYEVDKATESKGNTLIIGEGKRGFPPIVYAIIVIPILVLSIVYFDRFKKSPDEEIERIKDIAPDYAEVEDQNFIPKTQEMPREEVPPITVNSMGDFDQLISAAEAYVSRRLQRKEHEDHIKQDLEKANWPSDIVDKLIEKAKKK